MTARRRLFASVLLPIALTAILATATVGGGAERRVAAEGAGHVLQSQQATPALTPATRPVADPVSFLVVAVLAVLLGVGAAAGRYARIVRRRWGLAAEYHHAVRLRGPPLLQFG